MTIGQEEIFGPVLAIQPYEGEDDAVRIANSTPYGLAGGVWSADHGPGDRRRPPHPHRPDRDQRRRLQPPRPVRRLRPVRPRPRERPLRDRGAAAGQEPAAIDLESRGSVASTFGFRRLPAQVGVCSYGVFDGLDRGLGIFDRRSGAASHRRGEVTEQLRVPCKVMWTGDQNEFVVGRDAEVLHTGDDRLHPARLEFSSLQVPGAAEDCVSAPADQVGHPVRSRQR